VTWQRVKLDCIKATVPYAFVGGPFGSNLTTRDYMEEGVPVIRGNNLPADRSFNDDDFVFVTEKKADEMRANTAYPGDVVFTQRGTLGQVGVIPLESSFPRYIISQSQMKLTADLGAADPRFIYYFFRMPATIQKVINHALTSGVPHINLGILKEFEIILPDLAVQKRISDTLSTYDNLIENNQRRMVLLEEAARQLYREWFVRLRFPGREHTRITKGLPAEWEKKRIADVAECLGGGTPSTNSPEYWEDGDVTWVTPTDVTRNRHFVLLDSGKKITEAGLKNCSAKLVPPHAILMTSRASVGFFALAGREVCTNQGFISVVSHDPVLSSYLIFHLNDRVEEIRAMGSGSTYPEVSRGKFREFEVMVPKHTLTLAFDEQVTQVLRQIRVLKQQNQKLRAARDLLLPRLMSGEIAV
jgi:type I restriction enzyme S subunit